MQKRFLALLLFCVGCLSSLQAQKTPINGQRPQVEFKTTMGDFIVELYTDIAPRHSANFLRVVEQGIYDSTLFHRVIRNFMIQGGDTDSKTALPGQLLGNGGAPYTLPAEFALPRAYHHRGALAAARENDTTNPERASASTQFYVVWGRVFTEEELDIVEERIVKMTGKLNNLTPQMRADYATRGGTPHLDGQYTVFGQVVEGLKVIEKIQKEVTDENDRPIEDVRILQARVLK